MLRPWSRIVNLWRNLFRRARVEQDLREELHAYVDLLIATKIEQNMAPAEARRQALSELGGEEQVKESVREVRMGYHIETLLRDLRLGCRMLLRKPGFTAVAIIALALGIGANSAIFTIVNGVLLRPLGFKEANRLVVIREVNPQKGDQVRFVSGGDLQEWRSQSRSFEDMACRVVANFRSTGGDSPEDVYGSQVSASFFSTLGVKPALGRTLLPHDEQPDADRVVVLTDSFWQSHFGADPNVVGRTLILNDKVHTIVGILPASFRETLQSTPGHSLLWTPIVPEPNQPTRHGPGPLEVFARLKADTSMAQARAELQTISERLAREYPKSNTDFVASVEPLHDQVVGSVRSMLFILIAAVGFVLLIACANIANLMLARTIEREKEIAIRTALGAGRLRVIRQLLTEGALLSLIGGGAGLLLALWGLKAITPLIPSSVPRIDEIRIDLRVLGFTLVVSLATGLLFGLAPALQSSRVDLVESLKDIGRRSMGGHRGRRLRGFLVISQVSLTLVLLTCAGLMINSFIRLYRVDPGYNIKNLLTLSIRRPRPRSEEASQWPAYFTRLIAEARSVPGVRGVAAVTPVPLENSPFSWEIGIVGRPTSNPDEKQLVSYAIVSPQYLQFMGVRLVRGRYFSDEDGPAASPVVVINESMARRYWPDQEPLGQQLSVKEDPKHEKIFQVIGVVSDYRGMLDAKARPQMFVSHLQSPSPAMTLVVRTEADPMALAGQMRRVLHDIDKNQPIGYMSTMEKDRQRFLIEPRFYLLLFSIFAAVAVILAVVGIYGVMSHAVSQRTYEIGVRMALGAQSGDVLRLVIGQGAALVLLGIVIGVGASWGMTRMMSSLLYEVSARDPMTFVMIALLLTGTAILACYLPARRATRVDPLMALRCE